MTDPHVAIIATSRRSGSRSQILARAVAGTLAKLGIDYDAVDLGSHPLPVYDPDGDGGEPVAELRATLGRATAALFALPIYNWDVDAGAKTAIEWAGDALSGKTVGFLCAAGGQRSYMSVLSFANSLMLDFRCWIVPRFVYAVDADFVDGAPAAALAARIGEIGEALVEHA